MDEKTIEFSIGDYKYKVIRDGEVSVKANKNKEQYEPIPCTVEYEGVVYAVTSMEECFLGVSTLEIAPPVPDGVTNMSYCFFRCSSLVEAPSIPDGVTNMGGCFDGCTSLVKAPSIPDSVTNMRGCFCECIFLAEAPVLPDGVTDLTACFESCLSLVKAPSIPDSVTNMGNCFYNCTDLVKAPVIPCGMKENGMYGCFEGCSNIVEMPVLPDGVTELGLGECFGGDAYPGTDFFVSATADDPAIGSGNEDRPELTAAWWSFDKLSRDERIRKLTHSFMVIPDDSGSRIMIEIDGAKTWCNVSPVGPSPADFKRFVAEIKDGEYVFFSWASEPGGYTWEIQRRRNVFYVIAPDIVKGFFIPRNVFLHEIDGLTAEW